MNRFDIFFSRELDKRAKEDLKRELPTFEIIDSLHIKNMGKSYINFSSNDYLGLSNNANLKIKGEEFLRQYGTGSGASRLITSNASYYGKIEEKLANFLGTEAALIFPSGWQANVGVVASLIENFPKPVWVFTDKLNHASLHYGCKAGQVRQIRFSHNDLDHLQTRLKKIEGEKGSRIILTETIFSMDGDVCDLKRLRSIADQFNAFLFLDDAHATGIFGSKGEGLAPAFADLTMGTFSKAWGSFGAYIAGSRDLCEWLVNFCSAFIHTTALPAAVIGSIEAALELMPSLTNQRAFLVKQSEKVRKQLESLGYQCGQSISHIIPIIVGSPIKAQLIANALKEKNIWITPIRPPTVPFHGSRLRLTLSAGHREDEIEYLLKSFHSIDLISIH